MNIQFREIDFRRAETGDKPAPRKTDRAIIAAGLLGAIAASSCCILPLGLFAVGIGGAWIGNLTALSPYQPVFIAVTLPVLGYGFYRVYGKPGRACAADAACARPLPKTAVKAGLWAATVLIAAAAAFPYVAPPLLGLG